MTTLSLEFSYAIIYYLVLMTSIGVTKNPEIAPAMLPFKAF
tara:strand:- start:963 stop:1085 length:123 start_codon:yes stop_codon:yes gene_type:complete